MNFTPFIYIPLVLYTLDLQYRTIETLPDWTGGYQWDYWKTLQSTIPEDLAGGPEQLKYSGIVPKDVVRSQPINSQYVMWVTQILH